MNKRNLQRLLKIFLLFGDGLFVFISIIVAYFIRFHTNFVEVKYGIPEIKYYIYMSPVIVLLYLLSFNYSALYRDMEKKSSADIVIYVTIASTFAVIVSLSITFFIRAFSFSRVVMLFTWLLSVILLSVWRIIYKKFYIYLYKKEKIIQKVILIGATGITASLINRMNLTFGNGYKIIGILDNKVKKGKNFNGVKVLGKIDDLKKIVKKYDCDEIFIGIQDFDRKKLTDIILENEGINVKVVSDILGLMTKDIDYDEMFGIPVFSIRELPLDKLHNRMIKRTFDVVFSFVCIVLLSPVLLIVALLVKLTSIGPVLYKQERISRWGRIFKIYKFRTMTVDAEKKTGPVWAKKDDARVTPIGKILRKTSIDELPQLFNVLKGEMSMVGPRPERPELVKKFKDIIPRYLERHKVKAGLTGWAQINGLRGNTSLHERVRYDLYYIQNWSLLFDIKIILRTILEVFHHANAY
ncbi:MAG: undecaprenyl-phosphate glucose phosphotransferase [Candidatus Goldbacteria bacterium]|nr:undecaprenyl-phosphate glucose phosphotransferase [Candidatus Goldiibacteriota bacterium]